MHCSAFWLIATIRRSAAAGVASVTGDGSIGVTDARRCCRCHYSSRCSEHDRQDASEIACATGAPHQSPVISAVAAVPATPETSRNEAGGGGIHRRRKRDGRRRRTLSSNTAHARPTWSSPRGWVADETFALSKHVRGSQLWVPILRWSGDRESSFPARIKSDKTWSNR